MKQLTPDDIQDLVTKAFVLEAITDKPGCTTRYADLPGKPLQDFVIAGINCSRHFRQFAIDRQNGSTVLFAHSLDALKSSNAHKSSKYVNFGLLEIMFPVVAARLKTDDPTKVIDAVVTLVKLSTHADALALLDTRTEAWSTSQSAHKAAFPVATYQHHTSVWDFYMAIHQDYPTGNSNHEWAKQYKQGLPILRSFFQTYRNAGEVMRSTKDVFLQERTANPDVAVGIVADMCAAALFLWLSYTDSQV